MRYTCVVITEKIQYTLDTLGISANSRAMIVTMMPWANRMLTWMPAGLTFWKNGGR